MKSDDPRDADISAGSLGLRKAPFGEIFDRRCRYLSPSRSHVMDSLKSGIGGGRPLLLLVAHAGLGKTALLSRLANDLYDSVRSIFVQGADWGSSHMRESVLSVVLSDKLAHAEMLDTLAKFALRQRSAGKRFVVIVDDADKLRGESLGSILQIAELSNRSGNLVQVVLSGQPAFRPGLLRSLRRASDSLRRGPMNLQLSRRSKRLSISAIDFGWLERSTLASSRRRLVRGLRISAGAFQPR